MELKSFITLGFALTLAALTPSAPAATVLSAQTTAAPDARFGLVGTGGAAFAARFGFRYYTLEGNYAEGKGAVFSSVDPANDPAAGFSVVREAAKLNVRTDALGQTNAQFQAKLNQYAKDLAVWYMTPSFLRGAKPAFVWYSPNAAALVQAESLQIVETIRREKARSPAITGTVWEIGNEPNLFPAITPAEYAALFTGFARVIKGEDAAAQVAMGSLFLPEPSTDLKAKFGEELEGKMRVELQAAGYYNTLNSSGVFTNLVNDVKNTLLARMLALPAREYLRQTLAALPAGTPHPDILSLHAYPYDDRAPFQDSAALQGILDTTFAGIRAMAGTFGDQMGGAPIWITEFGNIEQGLDENQVAGRMRQLLGAFSSDSAVAMWFHYKSTGSDDQFALFSSGPAPLTRLAVDAAFSPASGDFSCARLNAVGREYWRASHGGGECSDPVPDPIPDPVPDPVITPVTLVDSLRPAILNAEASALNAAGSIGWGWEKAPAPALPSQGMLAMLEIYRDTASVPLVKADSLPGSAWKPQVGAGSGPIWVRVKVSDGEGRSSFWSAWRLLNWEAAPSALSTGRAQSRAKVSPSITGKVAAAIRFRDGIEYDANGRSLGRVPAFAPLP
jgi:hypothetical protein